MMILPLALPHMAFPWPVSPPTLCIRDHLTSRILLEVPLPWGDTFTIRYIHSVDRTPVFEVFRAVLGEGLVLEETYFRMFGAGMGHWEGRGEIVQAGEWIKIRDIRQPLGRFLLRVGSPGVDHTVLLDGRQWNLSELAAGRRVEVFLLEE
ncbi:MAG: DUF1850 domain-containing protein [Deltaproteobacteria bacterium]|nr:DUF1850 domain-containing protein [Deltaproteobacteria bacterium]